MEFPRYIHDEIGFYVYRLIDPRNNETFYIGKGWGNRVFDHVRREGKIKRATDDIMSLKIKRIRDIHKAKLAVEHVIHRWKLQEREAYCVESALIDAYPKLSNEIAGHKARKHGLISPEELAGRLSHEELCFDEPVLLLDITRTFSRRNPQRASVYDAARWAWPVSLKRVRKIEHVLAHRDGCVIAVFDVAPSGWMDASKPENFPDMQFTAQMRERVTDWKHRKLGFRGKKADAEVADRYLHKIVPKAYRNSQTGVRYAPN